MISKHDFKNFFSKNNFNPDNPINTVVTDCYGTAVAVHNQSNHFIMLLSEVPKSQAEF